MDRIIEIKVNGNYLNKDNKVGGVQHEANVTNLRIEFDAGWDGYAKKVTFWDANGENPVERTLTADLLEDITASSRIYMCPIPGEALAESGECTFVIDGYMDGKRQRSISDTLIVREAPFISQAGQPADPTPTQAEQLQAQIDTLLEEITEQATIATNKAEDAASYASAAAGSADNAAASETAAKASKTAAKASETAAAGSASAAENSATSASTSAYEASASAYEAATSESAAKSSENAAKASETAAASSASAANASETAAKASETAAKACETSAAGSADDAADSATSAQTAAAQASQQATAAAGSATYAAASAASAAESAAKAAEIAGGDFATKSEAHGYVNTHNTSDTAHEDIRQAVSSAASAAVAAQQAASNAASAASAAQKTADNAIPASEKGLAGGVASLGDDGKVPSTQLPSLDYITSNQKGAANGVATLGEDALLAAAQRPKAGGLYRDDGKTTLEKSLTEISTTLQNKADKEDIPKAVLNVTTNAGVVVTATNGSKVLSATADSSGLAVLYPDEFGTWTLKATISGKSLEVPLEIDAIAVFNTYLFDLESASWEMISEVAEAGNAASVWSVGDTKTVNLNGVFYTAQIIGFNHDTKTDGGKAGITFQLVDCLNTTYQMNSSDTNVGGWKSSAMRSRMSEFLGQLDEDLQSVIKPVNKLVSVGNNTSTIEIVSDKLFLLSEVEVYGSTTYAFAGEGSQYEWYKAGNTTIKNSNGSAIIWWERSPYNSNANYFCRSYNGHVDRGSANGSYGVSFAFCV